MLHRESLEVKWSKNNLQLHVNDLIFNSSDEILLVSVSTDPFESLKQFKIIVCSARNMIYVTYTVYSN